MLPTLDSSNNLLFIDNFTLRFVRKPKRGEVIVAQNPNKAKTTLVKRVKYLEGETAEFEN